MYIRVAQDEVCFIAFEDPVLDFTVGSGYVVIRSIGGSWRGVGE